MAIPFDKELPEHIPVAIAMRVKLLLNESNAPLVDRLRSIGEQIDFYHKLSEGWFEVDNENLEILLDIFSEIIAWIKSNGDRQRPLPKH